MTRKPRPGDPVAAAGEALAALDAHLDKWRRVIAYRERLREQCVNSERERTFPKRTRDANRDALDARLNELRARDLVLEAARNRAVEAQFALDFHALWLKPKRRPIEALDRLIAKYSGMHERLAISGSTRMVAERGIYFAVSHLERAIKELRAETVPLDELRPSRQYEVRAMANARKLAGLAMALNAADELAPGAEGALLTSSIPDLGEAVMQMDVVARALTAAEAPPRSAEAKARERSYLEEAEDLFAWLAERLDDTETVSHPQGPQFAAFIVLRAYLVTRHRVPVVTPPLGDVTTIRDWFNEGRASVSGRDR